MPESPVTPESVEQFLRSTWGEVTHLQPLPGGLAAQAYRFDHAGAPYILRLKSWRGGFEKDAFVSRTFADSSLPIPEIVLVADFDGALAACISRRAPGVRLQDLNPTQMEALTPAILQTITAISERDLTGTAGFGRFDASGQGPYATWQAFLTGYGDLQHAVWQGAAEILPLAGQMVEAIARLAPACPESRHLIHGDFGSYNVLSDGTAITAVIDWDLALFGDPLYEFANLLFWRETHLAALIEQVEGRFHGSGPEQERLVCYQLRIGLQELFDAASGEATFGGDWLTARCRALLDGLKDG